MGLTIGNSITINFASSDKIAKGFELNQSEAAALDAAVGATREGTWEAVFLEFRCLPSTPNRPPCITNHWSIRV